MLKIWIEVPDTADIEGTLLEVSKSRTLEKEKFEERLREYKKMVVWERFELSVDCSTHPFQGCTIGHSDTKPNFEKVIIQ